jgi:hypothetical protein
MPAFLARRYADPVEVERRDDVPAAFVRDGRRYEVRAVLAHWWETGAWWLDAADTAGPAVADAERELWRVEAAARGRSVAVVELCFAWATGRWTVTAVLD